EGLPRLSAPARAQAQAWCCHRGRQHRRGPPGSAALPRSRAQRWRPLQEPRLRLRPRRHGSECADMKLAAFLSPGGDLTATIDLTRRAEELGYDSVWGTHGAGRHSFLVLAAYRAATTRLGLGNGVVLIYPRHRVLTGRAALGMVEARGRRARAGMVEGHKASVGGMRGLALAGPWTAMGEYVAVLRGACGSGAHFDGAMYHAHWTMALPTRLPAPPIYLA